MENEMTEQSKDTTPHKKGGCLKIFLIFILVGVIGTSAAGFFLWQRIAKSLTTNNLPTAPTITIIQGTTEKKDGISWQPLNSGDTVQTGDTIKTAKGADAYITFPSGSELRLDEQTEITVTTTNSETTAIFQSLGRTWSRIGKLLGKSQSYEIETPTAVATVRGTAFSTNVTTEQTAVETEENTVDVGALERDSTTKNIVEHITVDEGNSTIVRKADVTDIRSGKKKLFKEKIRDEIRNSEWFKRNRDRDARFLERLQAKGISPWEILNLIRSTSPEDLVKLRKFIQKVQSGQLKTSPEQEAQLRQIFGKQSFQNGQLNITPEQGAAGLRVVDAETFGDTAKWKTILQTAIPLIQKLQKSPLLQERIRALQESE